MAKATANDVIKWQLRWIKENFDQLSESEVNLCISYEEQFNRNGYLSERQMEVLESIYNRRT